MFRVLFILTLLIPFAVLADLDVHKDGQKVLLSDSCATAKDMVASLSQWTQSLQEGKGCGNLQPFKKEDNVCSYDITSCVPAHVAKYQSTKLAEDGPNCWNLSLVMSGILPSLRFASPDEMNFFMGPPLCTALKDGEPRKPGDIGAVRTVVKGGDNAEFHAFIYISEKLSYSKGGVTKHSPYTLQDTTRTLDLYDVARDPECRKNQINDNENCRRAVAYYRCESLTSYMDKHQEIPKNVRQSLDKLSTAEKCISEQAIKGVTLSDASKKNIIETSQALLKYAQEAKQSPEFKKMSQEQQLFVVNALYFRLDSVATQLKFNGEQSLSTQTHDLSEAFRDAAVQLFK